MALIALAGGKGSPGVSTAALALAAVWPRRALLAECDVAGGDLIYRQTAENGAPLDPNRGMLSLAATARRGLAPQQLWDHSQRLSGGLDALIGLGSAEQAAGWTGQWSLLGRTFADLGRVQGADVIADCGRIGPDSPTIDLLAASSLILLVTRTRPEQIAQVRDRAAALCARLHGITPGGTPGAGALATPPVGLLLIVDPHQRRRLTSQVSELMAASGLPVQVIGVLAEDESGAEQLAGRRRGRVSRSLLIRSTREVAGVLRNRFGLASGPTPQAAPQTAVPAPAPAPAPTQSVAPQQVSRFEGQPAPRHAAQPAAAQQAAQQPPAAQQPQPQTNWDLAPGWTPPQPDPAAPADRSWETRTGSFRLATPRPRPDAPAQGRPHSDDQEVN